MSIGFRDYGVCGWKKTAGACPLSFLTEKVWEVMEITKDQYLAGAPLKAAEAFPYCTEEDADWCGPCWNNPANTWCCKHRGGKDPNCGVDASTGKYCEGCHQGDDCINICTKPPKGAVGSTNIKITNATDNDVTIAFVTGASGGACKDVNKMISYQWVAQNTNWCKNPQQEGGPNAGFDGDNNKNGLFPPGCTDCILAVEGRIPCPKITPNPKCQPKRICNIYRGGWTGGTVEYVISDLPKPK